MKSLAVAFPRAMPALLIAVLAMIGAPAFAQQMDVPPESAPHSNGAGAAVTDSWITTKVKSELLSDSTARQADVGVKTTNGVVALSGTAASQDAIDRIKGIAQKVHGVKSVDASGLKSK